MIYTDRLTPPDHWPPLIRYPKYRPHRRLSIQWFLIWAIISLVLSVIALIIVFAVEHSWFRDNYNGTTTQYGLWRLCFFRNNSCDSWFSSNGPYSLYISDRLSQARTGINAWQALEIVFLFLTTATLVIAVASIVCYQLRNSLYYYLAILAVFCAGPAACVGIAALFVFGFSVFNVAITPRELDWCFYLNLAAVILAVIGALLLSIYDALLRKPSRNKRDNDVVVETFADLNAHPAALSPSTFVVVRRNKRKRNRPYDYPQVLHPNHYFPASTYNERIPNGVTRTNYVSNTNHPPLSPYTSVTTTRETRTVLPPPPQPPPPPPPPPPPLPLTSHRSLEYTPPNLLTSTSMTTIAPQPSIPFQTQPFRTTISSYPYPSQSPPSNWYRTGGNVMDRSIGYASEPTPDYVQRDYFYPNRSVITDRSFEQRQEPRLLHYYTGYDYFATVDPSDAVLTRHHSPIRGPGTPIRYRANSSYQQGDYIKSIM